MPELDDITLLRQYARSNSEAAFSALVERHVNLVYATAARSVGQPQAAEEIAQAVFIILAKKARSLSRKTVLSGWLYRATRLTAANYLRSQIRRQKREQEAYMQTTLNEPASEAWSQIAPLLDDALERLGEKDRNAIMLRYFENRNLREVGAALGASEDAAKMRVNRALERLRKFFTRRGVTLSAATIAGAVSVHSAQAAPAGLAKTVSALALAKGAAGGGSTLTLVKGVLKLMAWTKAKTATVVGVGILLAAGTTVILVNIHAAPRLAVVFLGVENNPASHPLKGAAVFHNAKGLCAIFKVTNVGKTAVWFDTCALEQKVGSEWLRTAVPPYPSRVAAWSAGLRPQYLISSDDLNNVYPPGASWYYVVEWPPDISTNATWRLELRYARAPSTLVGRFGTAVEGNLFAERNGATIHTPQVTP